MKCKKVLNTIIVTLVLLIICNNVISKNTNKNKIKENTNKSKYLKKHFHDHSPTKIVNANNNGHYEKIKQTVTKYFYVNDEKPSGLPGSFTVSKKEAWIF